MQAFFYTSTLSNRCQIFLQSLVGSKMQYSGLIPFDLKNALMFFINVPEIL